MYDGNNSWRANRMDKNYRMVTLIQDDLKKRYQAEDISAAGRNQICQGKMLWEMKKGKGKDKAILSYSLNSFLVAVLCADQKAFAEWGKKNESCLYHKGVGFLLERKLEVDAKEPEDCFRGIVEEAVEEEAIARIWSVLLFPVWKKTEQSFFPLSSLEHAFQKAKKQEQRKIAKMVLRASNEIVYPEKKTEALSLVREHMPGIYADILEIDDWQIRQLLPYEVLRDQFWRKTGKAGRKDRRIEISEIASKVLLNETLFCGMESPAEGEHIFQWPKNYFTGDQTIAAMRQAWMKAIRETEPEMKRITEFASRLNEWEIWLDEKKEDKKEYSDGITTYLHFLMALWNKASDGYVKVIKEQIKKLSMRTQDLKKRYVDGELSLRNHG